MEHAREDIELRMLKEQQVEAKRVVEAINTALAQDGEVLLSNSEIARIHELEVTDEDMEKQYEKMADESGMPLPKIKADYSKDNYASETYDDEGSPVMLHKSIIKK